MSHSSSTIICHFTLSDASMLHAICGIEMKLRVYFYIDNINDVLLEQRKHRNKILVIPRYRLLRHRYPCKDVLAMKDFKTWEFQVNLAVD